MAQWEWAAQSRRCRCVDCGFVLDEVATHWPTCAPILRDVIKSPETTCEPGARNKQAFTLNGGCGTHVDAPAHFIPDGRTVEELTSEELVNVPLVVVDVSAKVAADADYRCTRADVVADEARHGKIPRGALVCVRTGWAEARYEDREAYYNADPAEVDAYTKLPRMRFPGVSRDAAAYVCDAGARGLGIDTLNPDGGSTPDFPVHHEVLGRDREAPASSESRLADQHRAGYIIENLRLSPDVPPRGALAVVAPLNMRGAPEGPARVYASVPE